MLRKVYDSRFAQFFGICTYAPDDGGGDGGDGGDGKGGNTGGGGGGNNPPPKDPPPEWASEWGDKFDPDKAWSTIKSQRQSEAAAKNETKELRDKLKQYEDNGKSPLEKLTAENQELKEKLGTMEREQRTANVRSQITAAASAAGAHYPEDIAKLIDESAMDVGDDGKVRNAAKLVGDLRKDRPALFKPGSGADGGSGRGGTVPSGTSMNDMIRARAGYGQG